MPKFLLKGHSIKYILNMTANSSFFLTLLPNGNSNDQNNIYSFVMWIVVAQSPNHVQLFGIPWTEACQASLSLTISQSLPKFMSNEFVMPSSHLILCYPLLLLPSLFPSIRGVSNEPTLCIRWPNVGASFSKSVLLTS